MQFVPYRVLRNEPAVLRKKLESEGDLVVTVGGKPFAVMISVAEEENIQDILLSRFQGKGTPTPMMLCLRRCSLRPMQTHW